MFVIINSIIWKKKKNNGYNFYSMCRGLVLTAGCSLTSDLKLAKTYDWSKHFVWFSQRDARCQTLKVAGSINRCYPLTLENMAEGPDVWMTSQPWDQLMWRWRRWVLAEETDLVASKVPVFPLFSVLGLTPQTGQSWKAGKDGGQTKGNM